MEQIAVVVAVVINANDEVLIAKRPLQKHCGGLWEFPGGKMHDGESELHALTREMQEECGITIDAAEKLCEITHDYPEKSVRLLVWRATQFSGEAQGLEGQIIRWVEIADLVNYEFPAANQEILLHLQQRAAIFCAQT